MRIGEALAHHAAPVDAVIRRKEIYINLDNTQIKSYEPTKNWKYLQIKYYTNNLSLVMFIILYILLQLLSLAIQIYHYEREHSDKAIIAAKSFGVLLNFNLALTVLLVLRYILTRLRNRKFIRSLLPFDHFIELHKYIGVYLIVLSIGHTVAHCFHLCEIFIECLRLVLVLIIIHFKF